jgi:hypothetical protein
MSQARAAIDHKLSMIDEPEPPNYSSSVTQREAETDEQFTDADLKSLFGNLRY